MEGKFLSFAPLLIALVTTINGEMEAPIAKIGDGKYKIDNITIDKNKREITVPGEVNMTSGMIELLATTKTGKRHESVLVCDVEPYRLQVALLLIGLNPGGNIQYQGDPATPEGDPVLVWVKWAEKEKERVVRGEDLIFNKVEKKTMPHTHWVFSGSKTVNGKFVAQITGSLITTYHDPYTIMDNPLPTGADDTFYEVNRDIIPPLGTKVLLVIQAVEKEKTGKD